MGKAKNIIEQLNTLDEIAKIEAKSCTNKIDRSVMETICAFSNEPFLGGGDIILGIGAEEISKEGIVKRYKTIGVKDTDSLQNDIATRCASMFNQPIRPKIYVEHINDKNVIIISVDELDSHSKPLYFKTDGLPRGAYRRIGATDQRCTEDDMPVFYSSAESYDSAVIPDTSLDDIDEVALQRYRNLRENVNPQAEELTYNDTDLLKALGACKKDEKGELRLTLTGMLVFGKSMALRRLLPAVRVDYIRVHGTKWMQDADKRFETIDMRGPLILLLNRAYNAIVDDLPHGFILHEGDLQARTAIGLPGKALREALVNALIHRTYRTNQPIQIIRYSNRIEIVNPGFSLKPEESLGEPGSVLRNPFISAIFHDTNLAETKGSGIGAMHKMMENAEMMPPTFESDHTRNSFTIRLLLHHFLCEEDIEWLNNFAEYSLNDNQKLALVFVREVGAIDNFTYRQLTNLKRITATYELKKLCDYCLIYMKKHGNMTYYVAGDILNKFINKPTDLNDKPTDLNDKPTDLNDKPTDLNDKPTDLGSIPQSLQKRIDRLGKKANKTEVMGIVIELCKLTPLSIPEIANIIHRNSTYIKQNIIRPLRIQGFLEYTIPDMVNHPGQKYKATGK